MRTCPLGPRGRRGEAAIGRFRGQVTTSPSGLAKRDFRMDLNHLHSQGLASEYSGLSLAFPPCVLLRGLLPGGRCESGRAAGGVWPAATCRHPFRLWRLVRYLAIRSEAIDGECGHAGYAQAGVGRDG
jgi:hypothetical protein